jgi:hypothetical protein
VAAWPRRTCALVEKGCTETQSWLFEGVVVGDGEVLGFGLLVLGLGEMLLGLGFGLVLIVGLGLGLVLAVALLLGLPVGLGLRRPGTGLLVALELTLELALGSGVRLGLALGDDLPRAALCAADPEKPDAEADRAVAPLCPAFRAEASLAEAGRVPHGFFTTEARAAWVPAKNTLTRPHETTAVPAHARSVADPERRTFTTSTSP